jgi:hypothetical protein
MPCVHASGFSGFGDFRKTFPHHAHRSPRSAGASCVSACSVIHSPSRSQSQRVSGINRTTRWLDDFAHKKHVRPPECVCSTDGAIQTGTLYRRGAIVQCSTRATLTSKPFPQVNRLGDVARHSSHRPTVFRRRRTRRRSTMRQYQSVMMSCKRRNGSDMGSQPLCYLRLVAQFFSNCCSPVRHVSGGDLDVSV